MKHKFIKNLVCLILVSVSLLGFNSVSANAEWKQNSNGKWNYITEDGSILKNTWFYDKSTNVWCHLNENGIRNIGWFQDKGKWYYLYNDGKLAINTTTPDGYKVGNDGSWTQNNIVANTNINSGNTTTNNINNGVINNYYGTENNNFNNQPVNDTTITENIPITIPSNWETLGNNKYAINGRSVVTYSASNMTGWTQESVLNDLKRTTYQQGNYDSDMGLVNYNGNNGYAYSYTSIEKDSIRKILCIVIFKNNKHYDFVFISDYGNYNEDRKELENVLNTTLKF